MIDFKEELAKYKPALDVDDLQEDLQLGEMQDVLDWLQRTTGKGKVNDD